MLPGPVLMRRLPYDPVEGFTAITLHVTLATDAPATAIQRAIDLSHDKYCSVWHSLRQDIDFQVTFAVTP